MKNIVLTLLFLLSSLAASFAQSHRLFTTDEELSSSLINFIYQDHNNMIWIATEDGLNRYDGVKFTVYRHEPGNEHSLAHNYVKVIFEDDKGRLIVGTYAGLQLYDEATDTFSRLATDESGAPFTSFITHILQRKNGEIWATGNRLVKLDITPDGELHIQWAKLPAGVPTEMLEYALEDKSGNLWLVKEGDGIYRVSPDNQVRHYDEGQHAFAILTLCEDKWGNIYGGSPRNGLFRYDKKQDTFVSLSYLSDEKLSVRSIYCTDQNTLYICTDGEGLKQLDIQGNQLSDFLIEDDRIDSHRAKVHFMFQDRTGNYWLAIYQKGVMMIPTHPNGFKYLGYKSVSRNLIGSHCVTSLYQSSDGTMYVGTDNDGLYALTQSGKQGRHYVPNNTPHSVPPILMSIYEDSEHNLWLGSFVNGAAFLDTQSGRCTYLREPGNKKWEAVRNVYAFAEDGDKRVWIATMGGSLFCYDLRNRKLRNYPQLEGKITNDWACSLLYSATDNCLYVGTYNGLYCVDLKTEDLNVSFTLGTHIIYTLCEDREGNLWVGTSDGLICWNRKKQEQTTYTTANGLPHNSVYGILFDGRDCLWISTNRGLSRFFLPQRRFVNYTVHDGLQGNEFCKNAVFRSKDGSLWFGGINGVTYFNPQDIIVPDKKWQLRITDFYLHDQPVRVGTRSGRHEVISVPVHKADDFYLSYRDNSFSIEFSTVELNTARRLTYYYAMNDTVWNELPADANRISFVDLPAGTYHFRIKTKDYLTESDSREITIHISPAWWASVWAKTGYVLIAIAALICAYLLLRNHYRTQQKMLEHIHREEINETRQRFFINISHEIRTPMTLIISPLQQLMHNDRDEGRQKIYRVIYRNSERILRLINQLMDIRKIEKNQMKLTYQEVELLGFIRDLCDMFAEVAAQKHITLDFRHNDLTEMKVWLDIANFDKVILNLLSNAFKFTPEGGHVEISASYGEDNATNGPLHRYVEIVVADTGKGITPSDLERIFERFYQASTEDSYKGTGIGLHLTRSLVELHHGHIHAENKPDGEKGSRFIVRIPAGNEHLHKDEMAALPLPDETIHEVSNSYVQLPATALAEDKQPAGRVNARVKHYILVVEDDEEIRNYISRELAADYHVGTCSNGKEALEVIFKQEPALIISDVMMPEMDGLTLCRMVKQNLHKRHIPIILLTAKTRDEDNIEGLETGADAYLTKPFNMKILRHTVENLIHSREYLRNVTPAALQGAEDEEKPNLQAPDDRLVERAIRIIKSHLSEPDISVEQIAVEVGYNRSHLGRKLKKLTGLSTRDFIRNIRLQQAADLLGEKRYAISEVADLVGFTSLSGFSTAFKEQFGMSPMEYREKLLKEHDTKDSHSNKSAIQT